MSIAYYKKEIKNPLDRTKSIYCLQSKSYGNIDRDTLISDMVRNASLTEQEATTALDYLFDAILRYLRLGNTVQLGRLGYFRYTISSEASDLPEEATPDKIKGLRLRFTPGKDIRKEVNEFPVKEWIDHFR
ncbi:HU family DNA-binding protein [Bacteroidales bacterium OttesenSCG-928-I14]|nr:HU family DNA-binding protein [Bacteroidales bacterium OttesenSCG-928-I14]